MLLTMININICPSDEALKRVSIAFCDNGQGAALLDLIKALLKQRSVTVIFINEKSTLFFFFFTFIYLILF